MYEYRVKARWTKKQLAFLEENAYKLSDEKMAEMLGRTLKAVRRKRQDMELKKASGRGKVAKFEESANKNSVNADNKSNQDTPNSPPIG